MKLIALFAICFSALIGFAESSQASDSLGFFLQSEDGKKYVNMKPNSFVLLVKNDVFAEMDDSGTPSFETYYTDRVNLIEMLNDTMLGVQFISSDVDHYQNGLIVSTESRNRYDDNGPMMNVSLMDYDGMYYSSPFRMKARSTFFGMSIASVFTALIIAPIVSFQYSKGQDIYNKYERATYFGVVGASAGVALISVPMVFVLRPKYYSFSHDQSTNAKRKWRLGLRTLQ